MNKVAKKLEDSVELLTDMMDDLWLDNIPVEYDDLEPLLKTMDDAKKEIERMEEELKLIKWKYDTLVRLNKTERDKWPEWKKNIDLTAELEWKPNDMVNA